MAERPTCPEKGKIAFPDFDAAREACKAHHRRNWKKGIKEKIRAYICGYCGMWHIGRGPKGRDANWETMPIYRKDRTVA